MEEVIERANSTNYGLGSGVLSKNIDTALTFAQAIQAGSVWYISKFINSVKHRELLKLAFHSQFQK